MNYFLSLLLIGERYIKTIAANPPSGIPVVEVCTKSGVTVWTSLLPGVRTWGVR